MSDFIEVPASKRSLSLRRPVFGVGINDADYNARSTINGKTISCPYYARWISMLKRCYSEVFIQNRPTYIGCVVSNEWLTFSNFKKWMLNQDWKGMHLDKDIIRPNNKIYSKETCRFISASLNLLLTDSAAIRGLYPRGVDFYKRTGEYRAQIKVNAKKTHIGFYETPELASSAYIKAKSELILKKASEQTDELVANGLRMHAELLTK